jgi:hypothetical protein
MSIENLSKELDIIHEKIRAESNVDIQMTLMTERDQLLTQMAQAYHTDAAFYQKKISELEEKNRSKTVQMPYSFK